MTSIPMVDLFGQYQKIKPEVDQAIQNVINDTAFINGPAVSKFESSLRSYLQAGQVISCANGTDALQIVFMALDLPPGSEVIAPDFTFVATVEVIKLLGHIPVLVDVDPDTYNLIPEAVEEAITDKTKAIVPVHLFGQCCDMEKILSIAKKHDLYVVEDTAQAIGADYTFSDGTKKKAGTMGTAGTTSFFPSKNLGCFGDGGAIFTNDDKFADKIRLMKNHGMDKQYEYVEVGVNSRLDTIQAAILDIKLGHLDEYNNARREAANLYDSLLGDIPEVQVPVRSDFSTHIFHQYTLRIKGGKRNDLSAFLNEKGISNKIYYPDALHEHRVYTVSRFDAGKVENSLMLKNEVLSLPMHTELEQGKIRFICETIKDFFKRNNQ